MSGRYRVTVRGVMSERFCRGFTGVSRLVGADRTILSGDPRSAPPLDDVLRRLDNLGLEVVEVEQPHGTTAHTTPEA